MTSKKEKAVLSKIDFTALSVIITSVLYLWGWIYWSNYYHSFGLPYALGSVGFERLLLAGSFYLWYFISSYGPYVLASYIVCLALYQIAKRMAVHRLEETAKILGRLLAYLQKSRFMTCALVVLVISLGYDSSIGYIRNDAKLDAGIRMKKPATSATIVLKTPQPSLELNPQELDLLELRDEKYYFIRRPLNKSPYVIAIPGGEILSLRIDLVSDKPQ